MERLSVHILSFDMLCSYYTKMVHGMSIILPDAPLFIPVLFAHFLRKEVVTMARSSQLMLLY